MSILIKNISYSYKSRNEDESTFKLNNISMVFDKHLNFVIGKSGCGKTTLINIIIGLIKSDFGEILIDDRNIDSFTSFSIFQKIFYLPSEGNCIENITALDNLKLLAENEKIYNLVDAFGLKEVINLNIAKLSKGEQKKLSLIKSLVCKQKYVIIDEPTSNLDTQSIDLFYDLIKKDTLHTYIIFIHETNIKDDVKVYNLEKENEYENRR